MKLCLYLYFQVQFVLVIIHTSVNMYIHHLTASSCDFPQALNYAVFFYAISLIILFSNFFRQTYVVRKNKEKAEASNGIANGHLNGSVKHESVNGHSQNGVVRERVLNMEN